MTATKEPSPLLDFSNSLADIVERTGRSIITVNGRRRRPASGIHWRSGILVTTDHPFEEEVAVTLADDRTIAATLLGRDPGTDLAVLQVAADSLPVASVGTATSLKVGHLVMAIARTSESGVSASLGVISTLGESWRSWQGGRIDQLIRPSLMLYPGFSGSALVNSQGQVVGMNTTGPRHMALTIPAATVNRVVDQLVQGGRVVRGYLGLGMQSIQLPETLRRSLQLSQTSGVIVVSVEPDAPADRGGALIGDILVAMDGTPIAGVEEIHALLDPERIGQPLVVRLIRGGILTEVTITVGERPHREG